VSHVSTVLVFQADISRLMGTMVGDSGYSWRYQRCGLLAWNLRWSRSPAAVDYFPLGRVCSPKMITKELNLMMMQALDDDSHSYSRNCITLPVA
jgi:hypothetical protein